MSGYDAISSLYDAANSHVDYEGYAARVAGFFKDSGIGDGALVCEIGCGTGRMTRLLADAGYDMIGIDNSEGMLSVARDEGGEGILYLLQDMRDFELYGTVAAAVCFLDGVNHLTGRGDLDACFSLVHNYLDPDGVFFFDLNTPLKFDREYDGRDYVFEEEGAVLLWQNEYNSKSGVCDFYLTAFTEDEDGRYSREDTWWRERCYTRKKIVNALTRCGFADVRFLCETLDGDADADALRWYVTARAVK